MIHLEWRPEIAADGTSPKTPQSDSAFTIVHLLPENKSIIDIRLHSTAQPTTCTCWSLSLIMFQLLSLSNRPKHDALCENMTASTKPNVHNVSLTRQERPRPQATCTNLVKFGGAVSEIYESGHRQA